jgi:hypothetical protein
MTTKYSFIFELFINQVELSIFSENLLTKSPITQ